MAREYEGRVETLGVPGRDTTAAMRDFVDRHGLGHVRHAVDTDGNLWRHFGVSHQPTFVFIDDTREVRRAFGSKSPEDLTALLDRMINT